MTIGWNLPLLLPLFVGNLLGKGGCIEVDLIRKLTCPLKSLLSSLIVPFMGQVTCYFFWVVFLHNSKGENETEPLNPSETASDRD